MKPKKIAFLGLFGQKNLGNECTLQAMINHTRQHLPEAELKCICTGPEDVEARHGILAFEMYATATEGQHGTQNSRLTIMYKIIFRAWRELRHAARAFKTLRGHDLLIAPGTGLLVDHTTGFRGYPYYVFKWALLAKLCRCKFLVVSIGAGPIHHPLSKIFIKTALSMATYRSYRDVFSKEYIEGIGFPARNDPVFPDLAFSLPENTLIESRNADTYRPVVGVGLIDYYGQGSRQGWKGHEVYLDYINKTGIFITWLLDNHYQIRLLIGDMEYDMNAKRDVLEYLKKHGRSLEDGRITSEPIDTVEDLLKQLAKTDIVISPRFHNIILSLMLKKRVIALSYNEKFESLMHDFGLDHYCQRLDELDVGRLAKQLISIEKDHSLFGPCVHRKTEEYREALNSQYREIFMPLGEEANIGGFP